MAEKTTTSKSANYPEDSDCKENVFLVTNVIDGDTIIVNDNYSVRMIGINAPEKGMYFYEEAKQNLEILILNNEVCLESDITDKDKYGRLLRYVFDGNYFINYEMVKFGFANAYDYKPDTKYSELLNEAEEYAKINEKGIWERIDMEDIGIKINYDSEGKDEDYLNGEWVEIVNKGNKSIKLEDWSIKDMGTNIYVFDNVILYPGSSIFLFTGKGIDDNEKLYWDAERPVWNNDHDALYLRNSSGILVKYLSY
ncbi:MAG: lamin tail domain-containing protein [Actinomycetota bacterium]|nr:lamin tail domain-containing protein [Actinomycetota bacterium]